MTDLLPCPFCGGTDIQDEWDDAGYVMQRCMGCDALGPSVGNTFSGPIRKEQTLREEARRLWSQRANLLLGRPVIETDADKALNKAMEELLAQGDATLVDRGSAAP